MEQIELKAETREATRKRVRHIRAEGYVPGVLYGRQTENTPIQIESKTLHKVLSMAGGNVLIGLQVGDNEPVPTLAREVQRDIIRNNIIHIDFLQVVMTERIAADIPLVFVGEAPATKELGGILVHGMDAVEVECLPADLPASIEVDVSSLVNFNDSLTVSHLQVPSAVTILSDPETMMARIEAPRIVEEEEEEIVEEEEEVLEEPEMVGKKAEVEQEEAEEK
jgi:large subunit ribosomal protein L25